MTIKHIKTVTVPDPTQADLDAQIALGNYPPGTTLAQISLGSDWNSDHSLDANGLTFPGQVSPSYAQGKLIYDTTSESLTFYNNDSNVSLQVGQEEWIRVSNVTGSTIPNGTAVYLNGASGGLPSIALAQANAAATTIGAGLATEAIPNNSIGYVTCIGVVNGIDTSAFTAGQTVYISATVAGGLTATAPASPNYRYRIGIVGVSSATVGTIHVTPSTAALGNGTANQVYGINAAGTAAEYKSISSTTSNLVVNAANSITVQRAALTGDVTAVQNGNATTLATVNSNVGSFTSANITVNAKGLITAASNGTGGSVSIGGAVTSGTSGSVLYVDGSGNLAQDNANFNYTATGNGTLILNNIITKAATNFALTSGTPATTTSAGNTISMTAGVGGSTSGAGGAFNITAGSASGGTTDQGGGTLTLSAGVSTGSGTGFLNLRSYGGGGSGTGSASSSTISLQVIDNQPGSAWLDMPSGAIGALGSGGRGNNLWIGRANAGGQFFSDATSDDILYRGKNGKSLRFGIDNGSGTAASQFRIAAGVITLNASNLDMNGGSILNAKYQGAVVTTAFTATSNTTPADITGLSLSVVAGATYIFEVMLDTTSNIAGGIKVNFGGTATMTSYGGATVAFAAAASTSSTNTTYGVSDYAVTAVSVQKVNIKGRFVVNAAGTVTVQFAQNVSNAAASTVLTHSYLNLTRV